MICSKALNYFLTSTYDPNQKSNSAPPILSIRRHRVQMSEPLPQTLVKLVPPIGISVSPRWDCNLSVCILPKSVTPSLCNRSYRDYNANSLFLFIKFWSNRDEKIGPTKFAWQTLWLAYYQSRSCQVCAIGLTDITLCPKPNGIGPTELTWQSHRKA